MEQSKKQYAPPKLTTRGDLTAVTQTVTWVGPLDGGAFNVAHHGTS